MTHPFRTRHFLVFAASTAAAAGAVLLPTGAFAATPATPHTVVAESRPGNPGQNDNSSLLWVVPEGSDEGRIIVLPDAKDVHDNTGHSKPGQGKIHPGKGDRHDSTGVQAPGKSYEWECVAAPCGPPSQPPTVVVT
ncbi:hypothetical protein AB0I68_10690 [Streptomyces sp. NPDC050448]|uniref:hypothetical protein n=1 Tax=Streptomyces sp. NPDC050448 TaxID=3155404 RepID=UPI00344765B6